MTTATHPVASPAIKAAVSAGGLIQRFIRAMLESRARRIQYELEFHRSFNAYCEANDVPPLNSGHLRSGS